MNKAICYANLTLSHKKHPLQFTVGVGFQGKLINGRVKGVDLNKERKSLEEFNLKIRDQEIFELIRGYKGMESLAQFYLKKLKNKKIDFVVIKENNTEEVIIEREESLFEQAVNEYNNKKVSLSDAAKTAGLSKRDFIKKLENRGVSLNLDKETFDYSMKCAKKIMKK